MIATSVYINIGLLESLIRAAKTIGVTKHELVNQLFCKVLREQRLSDPVVFKRVSYQAGDPDKQWKNEPITLSPDMYEKCHDMRRVLKMSVSLLLAYAIKNYLSQLIHECTSKIIERKIKTKDDNSVSQYSIQCIFSTIAEGFIIKWIKKPRKNE